MNIKQQLLFTLTLTITIMASSVLAFSDSPDNNYPLSPSQAVPTLAPMLKKVLPSVVNISTQGTVAVEQHPMMNDPFFRRFAPQMPKERLTQGIGSGVIVNAKKGYIITNNHVIANADTIFITLQNKQKLKAKLIGTDAETDIAVLQVEAGDLTSIPLGDSDKLQVGDFAVAIGNPFGLSHTVTSGMVSALGRTDLGIEGYENFIQTDASINPGNSGGALIDLRGRLIGINSAILAPSGGNIGIGFAIPINMAKKIMDQLLEHGEIKRGLLGVQIQDLSSDLADAMDLKGIHGALVSRVSPKSTAKKAGIKAGDVIVAVNGKKITGASSLRTNIGLKRVGEKVSIDLYRDKQRKTVTAKIGGSTQGQMTASATKLPLLKGATLKELSKKQPYQGITKGLLITDVQANSPAAQVGLMGGDIILAVNKRKVTSIADLNKATALSRNQLLIHLQRGQNFLYLVIK
ncbi:serine protease DegQ [Bathymodiolus platifrons methanotrophic gill symbiont]|uniref:DegQ family serine endoprotease n=1 Tax=Bathymodiolus platifrons methanotrophic gill symbiont TaxID=113268 RepID=UPI000B407C31|nr:DegQ family serine endoprotease [Bathymodiolus platifrons methanotrophic gill symbiont]MCK5869842.1 DegQ family serine endoprotease [Methyloprofundus sp.]TXK98130.1 serine endoprotease DegQ [Methylococcaceae bacterium CS4]TXK99622.1 serine endoprotease DegQ [Methylococcaceae bacterium CS5]TXL05281.1 serine endoprotease DegQ [Methylococcaceae bacterium CS1]TXL08008.1 serine endoprotease DegQ [Methylococcaceae bacterium CS3]TXL11811.1 serine endoprotease DegQ [Methylococcaceae bacterium CS2]